MSRCECNAWFEKQRWLNCEGKPYSDSDLRLFRKMAEDREDYERAAEINNELKRRKNKKGATL